MNSLSISSSNGTLRHVAFFITSGLCLLSVACLVQYKLLGRVYDSQDLFFGKTKTVLFLGDSHSVRSFNPAVAKNWMNIGQISENVVCSYYSLKAVLRKNSQIHTVVLTCSPHNITANSDRSFFRKSADVKFNRYYWLFDKQGIDYASGNRAISFRAFLTYKLYFPLEWDRRTLKYLFHAKIPYIGSFQPHKIRTEQNDFINKAVRRHFYFNDVVTSVSPHQIEYLKKTATMTKAHDIRLLFITTPLQKGYAEQIPKNLNDALSGVMTELESKFDHVEYLDYRDIFFDHPELFYDGDHLNGDGADIFSGIFLKSLFL